VRITTSIKNNAPISDRACKPKTNGLVSGLNSADFQGVVEQAPRQAVAALQAFQHRLPERELNSTWCCVAGSSRRWQFSACSA
jgi:hypothetical protein